MKRLILISAFFSLTSYCFAQSGSTKSNPIFVNDNSGTPKEVYRLGTNPEFPGLRNLNSPQQVATAMKKTRGKAQLNSMLNDIGFTNGVADVDASMITPAYIPSGTRGNMGDGNYSSADIKLMGDNGTSSSKGVKAWKITSPSGDYMYVLGKCGNAFYPTSGTKTTACVNAPLNLSNTTKEVTLGGDAVSTSLQSTYVYYHKRHRRHALAPEFSDLNDPTASTPVLLSKSKSVTAIPQTYKVTVSTSNSNIQVCEDQPVNLSADINVEKTNEYTGNYPSKSNKQYKEVKKHVYKKIAKKMRHAEKKEAKVARLSGEEIKTDVAVR
jgi:hypothetical protein